MSKTHRAARMGKSSAGDGAAQVIVWVTVAAGKLWAGKPEDLMHLGGSQRCESKRLAIHKSTMLQSG